MKINGKRLKPMDAALISSQQQELLRERQKYETALAKLRECLAKAGYITAIAALTYSGEFHNRLRKNDKTPEHMHQVMIATRMLYHEAALKKAGIKVDTLLAVILMHDIPEDKLSQHEKFTKKTMRDKLCTHVVQQFPDAAKKATKRIVRMVFDLSKYDMKARKTDTSYFNKIAADPILLLAKLGDYEHNTETIGNLNAEKQAENINNALIFIEVARKARDTDPKIAPIAAIVDSYIDRIESHIEVYTNAIKTARTPKGEAIIAALKAAQLISAEA